MINVYVVLGDLASCSTYAVGVYSTKKLAQEAARQEIKYVYDAWGGDIEDNLETEDYIRLVDHGEFLAVMEIQERVLNDKEVTK